MKKLGLAVSAVLVICALALLPILLGGLPDDYANRIQEPEDLQGSVVFFVVLVILAATGFVNFVRISGLLRIGTRTLHALNVASLMIVAISAYLLLAVSFASLEALATGVVALAVAIGYWAASRDGS
jgi:hypothetical protein